MATRQRKMDAVALLKADHRKVEELFESFEKAHDSARKEKLAKQICMELTIHSMIEEEIFYPACTGQVGDEDLIEEAYVEHDGAKVLISELTNSSPDDEFFDAKVKVLSEMIKHHVNEEEKRDGLFAKSRQSEMDLEALGEQLAARKAELMNDIPSKSSGRQAGGDLRDR